MEIRQFKKRQNFPCPFQSKSAKISRRQNNPIYGIVSYRIISYRTPDQPGQCGLSSFPWHLSLHLGLWYTRLYGRWWYIVSYHIVHMINLDGVGYLPSHDISHFIWDSDILGSMVGDDISYHIISYTWSTWMEWVISLPMTSLTSSGTLIYSALW